MSTPSMKILKHLEEYSNISDEGNNNLKLSFWHLTKSRKRYQGGFLGSVDSSYSACELREEFSALSVLEVAEPALQEESGVVKKSEAIEWRLLDVAEAKEREEAKAQPKTDTGLRQRNQKGQQPQKKSSSMQQEDLRSIDPLNLFGGLTPTDLRRAQKSAKEALRKYVDAANKVAAIQKLLAKGR